MLGECKRNVWSARHSRVFYTLLDCSWKNFQVHYHNINAQVRIKHFNCKDVIRCNSPNLYSVTLCACCYGRISFHPVTKERKQYQNFDFTLKWTIFYAWTEKNGKQSNLLKLFSILAVEFLMKGVESRILSCCLVSVVFFRKYFQRLLSNALKVNLTCLFAIFWVLLNFLQISFSPPFCRKLFQDNRFGECQVSYILLNRNMHCFVPSWTRK